MKFEIFRFNKVESTNSSAIRIVKNSNIDYGMVIANEQKSGRGQYGKKWISYNGNLFISFFYSIDQLTLSLNQITTINSLSGVQEFPMRIKCATMAWHTVLSALKEKIN